MISNIFIFISFCDFSLQMKLIRNKLVFMELDRKTELA